MTAPPASSTCWDVAFSESRPTRWCSNPQAGMKPFEICGYLSLPAADVPFADGVLAVGESAPASVCAMEDTVSVPDLFNWLQCSADGSLSVSKSFLGSRGYWQQAWNMPSSSVNGLPYVRCVNTEQVNTFAPSITLTPQAADSSLGSARYALIDVLVDDQAQLDFTVSSDDGTIVWSAEVLHMQFDTPYPVYIEDLTPDTNYTFSVNASPFRPAGSALGSSSVSFLTTPDFTPPSMLLGFPYVVPGSTSAEAHLACTESAQVHLVVLTRSEADATVWLPTAVMQHADVLMSNVPFGDELTLPLASLQPSTDYTLLYVPVDADNANNAAFLPGRLDFATAGHDTPSVPAGCVLVGEEVWCADLDMHDPDLRKTRPYELCGLTSAPSSPYFVAHEGVFQQMLHASPCELPPFTDRSFTFYDETLAQSANEWECGKRGFDNTLDTLYLAQLHASMNEEVDDSLWNAIYNPFDVRSPVVRCVNYETTDTSPPRLLNPTSVLYEVLQRGVRVELKVSEPCTVQVAVLRVGVNPSNHDWSAVPSVAFHRRHVSKKIGVGELTPDTEYAVHVRATDYHDNTMLADNVDTFTTLVSTGPVATSGYPLVSDITPSTASLLLSFDLPCTVFYVLSPLPFPTTIQSIPPTSPRLLESVAVNVDYTLSSLSSAVQHTQSVPLTSLQASTTYVLRLAAHGGQEPGAYTEEVGHLVFTTPAASSPSLPAYCTRVDREVYCGREWGATPLVDSDPLHKLCTAAAPLSQPCFAPHERVYDVVHTKVVDCDDRASVRYAGTYQRPLLQSSDFFSYTTCPVIRDTYVPDREAGLISWFTGFTAPAASCWVVPLSDMPSSVFVRCPNLEEAVPTPPLQVPISVAVDYDSATVRLQPTHPATLRVLVEIEGSEPGLNGVEKRFEYRGDPVTVHFPALQLSTSYDVWVRVEYDEGVAMGYYLAHTFLVAEYYTAPPGQHCPDTDLVNNEADCRAAGDQNGYPFNKVTSSAERPRGCFWDSNGESYLNQNYTVVGNVWVGVGGLCHGDKASPSLIDEPFLQPSHAAPTRPYQLFGGLTVSADAPFTIRILVQACAGGCPDPAPADVLASPLWYESAVTRDTFDIRVPFTYNGETDLRVFFSLYNSADVTTAMHRLDMTFPAADFSPSTYPVPPACQWVVSEQGVEWEVWCRPRAASMWFETTPTPVVPLHELCGYADEIEAGVFVAGSQRTLAVLGQSVPCVQPVAPVQTQGSALFSSVRCDLNQRKNVLSRGVLGPSRPHQAWKTQVPRNTDAFVRCINLEYGFGGVPTSGSTVPSTATPSTPPTVPLSAPATAIPTVTDSPSMAPTTAPSGITIPSTVLPSIVSTVLPSIVSTVSPTTALTNSHTPFTTDAPTDVGTQTWDVTSIVFHMTTDVADVLQTFNSRRFDYDVYVPWDEAATSLTLQVTLLEETAASVSVSGVELPSPTPSSGRWVFASAPIAIPAQGSTGEVQVQVAFHGDERVYNVFITRTKEPTSTTVSVQLQLTLTADDVAILLSDSATQQWKQDLLQEIANKTSDATSQQVTYVEQLDVTNIELNGEVLEDGGQRTGSNPSTNAENSVKIIIVISSHSQGNAQQPDEVAAKLEAIVLSANNGQTEPDSILQNYTPNSPIIVLPDATFPPAVQPTPSKDGGSGYFLPLILSVVGVLLLVVVGSVCYRHRQHNMSKAMTPYHADHGHELGVVDGTSDANVVRAELDRQRHEAL